MATRRGAAVLQGAARSLRFPRLAIERDLNARSIRIPTPPSLLARIPVAWASASRSQCRQYASSATEDDGKLAKTPLYKLHAKHGAKFVPFAGFEMPVLYDDLSVGDSHRWTREKASLFDVSHMVQQVFSGPGAADFLSLITPTSIQSLKPYQSSLSALLLETGGILDDTIIMKLSDDSFYVVTNAGRREADQKYFTEQLMHWHKAQNAKVDWKVMSEHGLIALQGPLSAEILTSMLYHPTNDDLSSLFFGSSKYLTLRRPDGSESSPILVSRGGYTGEDGFELSIPSAEITEITCSMLSNAGPEKLRLAGLGARDSLRVEAGMCLYGHDLDETTTPPEAALAWIVGKDRRTAEAGFYGASVILEQLKLKKDGGKGVSRRRVGLLVEGAPAREGATIVDTDGNEIGKVTSGLPSPTLKKNIAMGYIKPVFSKVGSEVNVVVRSKARKAVVTKMPFVESKYYRG